MGNICKLCNNELDFIKLNGRTLSVETSQWDDCHDDFITKEVEINYCPICGRKLYGKIDYLYYKYKCDDIDTLKARCPIDLKLLDLYTEVTLEFKTVIDEIEEKEMKI